MFLFQGKFIRINFDASGYIAGANIGKVAHSHCRLICIPIRRE
jgi:hypothetical protein